MHFKLALHLSILVVLVLASTSSSFTQSYETPDPQWPSPNSVPTQDRASEINKLGTTVMMLYVLVNCKELDEQDAAILINAELRKTKGIDVKTQAATVAAGKRQATAKTTRQVCARFDQEDTYKIKQAVREERARLGTEAPKPPTLPEQSYDDIYRNAARKEKLGELTNEVRAIYFAIGCGVIDEQRASMGLLSAKMGLIWPQPDSPLFDLKQPNQYVGAQAQFFGVPPEVVNEAYMGARRAGLSDAGADPDARIVREVRTGVPSPPVAIPLYSGSVGKNCSHWGEHPENVLAIHRLANYLNQRATSGLVRYR